MPSYYTFSDACTTPHIASNPNTGVLSVRTNISQNCSVTQISGVPVDWSLSQLNVEQFSQFFGGALFVWVIGVSIGLLINVVRRARL